MFSFGCYCPLEDFETEFFRSLMIVKIIAIKSLQQFHRHYHLKVFELDIKTKFTNGFIKYKTTKPLPSFKIQ